MSDWHLKGEKQSEHLEVIWQFDLESRTLSVAFAILSVSQHEDEVKRAVAVAFDMAEFAPVVDFVLPSGVPALRFILDGMDKTESLLSRQEVSLLKFLAIF